MGREHEAVCLQAGILTSTKMKEEGRLSDMQGIPIQLAFSKDTSSMETKKGEKQRDCSQT